MMSFMMGLISIFILMVKSSYDFIIAPNADPANIKMQYQGAQAISIDNSGNLILQSSLGAIIHHFPIAYQIINGNKNCCSMPIHLIKIITYHLYAVIIVTTINMIYYIFTYAGSSSYDRSYAIDVNSAGNSVITGTTSSALYPTTTGAYDTIINGDADIFITKLNQSGSALVFSTFIGGSSTDRANSIKVDASGYIYIVGSTYSSNLPTTTGSYQHQTHQR